MKIAYISDTHFDSHLKYYHWDSKNFERVFDTVFKGIFLPADVLIVAGDIGHDIEMNKKCLGYLKSKYKHIVVVLGNHDYYSLGQLQHLDYQTLIVQLTIHYSTLGIHVLNGNTVNLDGVTFGGSPGWYGGSMEPEEEMMKKWLFGLADSRYIKGLENPNTLYVEEVTKIRAVLKKKPDIMITHVRPTINPAHTHKKWKNSAYNIFFGFNGEKMLKSLKHPPKYWIYGHVHDGATLEVGGVKLLCNPLGYFGETPWIPTKIIEI